jgi:sodium ion-translocating decarboxylase beta subunit
VADLLSQLQQLAAASGIAALTWQTPVMLALGGLGIYLGIRREIEPLLLVPIGFSVMMVNMPLGGLMDRAGEGDHAIPGLFWIFNEFGLRTDLIPCLIFLGLGAMTDFGPLIANPKTLLLGAAAQLGVFVSFFGALLMDFDLSEASSIGIIGGADGPTTLFTASSLQVSDTVLGSCAIAAYSYMAMVPIIQPPIIRLLTSKEERGITMRQLRPVSKREKILFPIVAAVLICSLVPKATPLISMFMLGNLFLTSGVVERLRDAARNELMGIVTIFLGIAVGSTMVGEEFLTWRVLGIYVLGLVAFCFSTAGGVIFAKLMNLFLREKINPLLGSAGVSAVPMAARVSEIMGNEANPKCHILMHAMAPNVAGVVGTVVASGIFITLVQ